MNRAADMQGDAALLTGLWYFAAPSRDVRAGRLLRKILFDEPIVFGRTKAGAVFALRDVCPHRGAPLSAGRIEEDVVRCPYHGWRFRADGQCAAIPALPSNDPFDASKVRVTSYAMQEASGLIWIYHAAPMRGDLAPETPAPDIGLGDASHPKVIAHAAAEGPYDEAVIGLVDPAHTPFVHRQWWWREGAGLKDKVKSFTPSELGFTMTAHKPSSNSRIYRVLGGAPTTEIAFRLPGVRLETIRTGKKTILGLTAITPAEAGRSEITHMLYWDLPLLTLAQPFVQRMATNFLGQDGAILSAQNRNLSRLDHRPLYVGDADEPAKWYMRLKRAWRERTPGAAFVNPVSGGDLRWRT